jgi:hypothetical protein
MPVITVLERKSETKEKRKTRRKRREISEKQSKTKGIKIEKELTKNQ